MSTDIAISVDGISKKYLVGHRSIQRERYSTLRDVVGREARNFVRKAADVFRGSQIIQGDEVEEFWALKDVTFEVKEAEVLGIIGRNGAGKSTLLKVLSRITEPTQGRAKIRGRVASLLEVGTGFHSELSGRENIFMNGAILGMTKADIRQRFDEIVAFADVEKFLDTPVKRYSSGMHVRLAFAIAAHLQVDILVVDEVLAVGDAEFQRKCLGKMGQVAQDGRTVLFVSHDMSTVNRLCKRCILLESGRIKCEGDVHSVTANYLISGTGSMAAREWPDPSGREGDGVARLISVRVRQNGRISETVDIRFPVEIEMTYENYKEEANLMCGVSFFGSHGTHLFVTGDLSDPKWSRPRPRGIYSSTCRIPGNLFAEGLVRVAPEVSTRHPLYQTHFIAFDSVGFQVVDAGQPGSVRGTWGRPIPGVMRPMCEWWTVRVESNSAAVNLPVHEQVE
jgi:lipopolysaccharide transport system ATP-binding protein